MSALQVKLIITTLINTCILFALVDIMKKPTIWLLNYEPGDAVATKAQKLSRTQFNAEFWKGFCEAKIPLKKRLFLFSLTPAGSSLKTATGCFTNALP